MNDFPIREYRTVLHVRRRRWKDADGKSVSNDWQMVAKGTRYSKEFATFLKNSLDTSPITARSLQKPYHVASRGDRYLSRNSRHTQVPVPATTVSPDSSTFDMFQSSLT